MRRVKNRMPEFLLRLTWWGTESVGGMKVGHMSELSGGHRGVSYGRLSFCIL